MSRITLSQDTRMEHTLLSNIFIDQYMEEANEAQLKIYIYLLRMMSSGRATSVSDIADHFNYMEKDVLRALRYWEKKQLLGLQYDTDKNLIGICVRALPNHEESEATSMGEVVAMPVLHTVQEDPYEKPAYSLDQLAAFSSQESTSTLVFVAEQYLSKTLSPNDMRSLLYISDKLGFPVDLIDYLLQYCVDRGKRDMRYIEKVAINWAQENIKTAKEAAAHVHKYDKTVYTVMKALGKSETPTKVEVDYIRKWTNTFGFDLDLIEEACKRTVLSTDKRRFQYADGILSSWSEKGVHHLADVTRLDAEHQKQNTQTTQVASRTVSKTTQYQQFTQNTYDYSSLADVVSSN